MGSYWKQKIWSRLRSCLYEVAFVPTHVMTAQLAQSGRQERPSHRLLSTAPKSTTCWCHIGHCSLPISIVPASGMHAPWGGPQPACLWADVMQLGTLLNPPSASQQLLSVSVYTATCLLAACRPKQLVLPAVPESSGLLAACRNGHNELEDPSVTLPLTYQAVANHPPVAQLYSSHLLQQGVVTETDVRGWQVIALQPYW